MAKNCFIYETLESVKNLKIKRNDEGLMTLSGVFGVCGIRNNNKRIYEAKNYGNMVNEMKQRIKEEGGIPELIYLGHSRRIGTSKNYEYDVGKYFS